MSEKTMDKDVFQHFKGGRSGVQQRFGRLIGDALGEMSYSRATQLEKRMDLESDTLQAIVVGQFGGINSSVVKALMGPLGIKAEDGLGAIQNLTKEDGDYWAQKSKDVGFALGGGADSTEWSPSQKLRLFLLLRALEDL